MRTSCGSRAVGRAASLLAAVMTMSTLATASPGGAAMTFTRLSSLPTMTTPAPDAVPVTAAARASDGARAGELSPVSPGVFLPGGVLGVQLGSSWSSAKAASAFERVSCQLSTSRAPVFDELCFFESSSQVAGAPIRDGFIVRQGDRVVLIGTGIAIDDVDDPRVEAVMRRFAAQVRARSQQTGPEVLFVNPPPRVLSEVELLGFEKSAPVLLVELAAHGRELAVLYGYLGPVNAFSSLARE